MNKIRSMGLFEWLLLVTLSVLWGSSFFFMGTLNNLIPFSLIFWGQTQISSSLTAILNATTPLWAVLLSTSVAYVIYFRLLSTAGVTNLLLVTFLIPVSALFLGMTFLSESLDFRHFIGMMFIGLGLAAIDGRPWALIRLWMQRGNERRQRPKITLIDKKNC